MSYTRTTFKQMHIDRLNALAGRATCDRGKCAALFVDPEEDIEVAQGYVGSAPGEPHCDEVGHKWEYRVKSFDHRGKTSIIVDYSQHCVRTIHAEMNAVAAAAIRGISLKGCILYVTMVPCFNCANVLLRLSLKKIIALNQHQTSDDSIALFKKHNIPLEILSEELLYESKTGPQDDIPEL